VCATHKLLSKGDKKKLDAGLDDYNRRQSGAILVDALIVLRVQERVSGILDSLVNITCTIGLQVERLHPGVAKEGRESNMPKARARERPVSQTT
jgi:hypothetical protein